MAPRALYLRCRPALHQPIVHHLPPREAALHGDEAQRDVILPGQVLPATQRTQIVRKAAKCVRSLRSAKVGAAAQNERIETHSSLVLGSHLVPLKYGTDSRASNTSRFISSRSPVEEAVISESAEPHVRGQALSSPCYSQ